MKEFEKLKKQNLPFLCVDDKFDTCFWAMYLKKDKTYEVSRLLDELLGNLAKVGFCYYFSVCDLILHTHDFTSVVEHLYRYPESFCIPQEHWDEYSKQELKYLKKVQEYLILVGLKDMVNNEAFDERGNNKLVDLYSEYGQVTYSKLMVDAIISKEKDYEVYVYYPFSRSRVGEKILVSDSDGYRCAIKVISEEIMPFDKLSSDMVNYKLGDFNSFSEYKNSLFLKFVEDAKIFNEIFDRESFISYVKFEVIDKF